ncbi:hypothetical protein ACEPAG_2605 [Sanghuangporus baumii]
MSYCAYPKKPSDLKEEGNGDLLDRVTASISKKNFVRHRNPLDTVFSHGFGKGLIHLVLKVQLIQIPSSFKRPRSPSQDDGVEQRHNKQVNFGSRAFAPPSAAKTSEMRSQQSKIPIYNGRPGDLCGPHIAIYHEAFARMKDDLDHPEGIEVTAEELKWTHQLFEGSMKFYRSEGVDGTRDLWEKLLGVVIRKLVSEGGETIANGGATVDCFVSGASCERALICDFEWKQDLRNPGDVGFRGGCSYQKIVEQAVNKRIRNSTCCPSLIIGIIGPYFCIMGAVFVDIPIMELLTGWVYLSDKPQGCVLGIARILKAAKNALCRLRDYYLNLPFKDEPDRVAYLPMPAVKDGSPQPPALRYIDRLIKEDKARPLFRAQMGDRDVIVKFPDRYCRDAHEHLALEELAPALHFCEPIRGGLYMVVMDYVKEVAANDSAGKIPCEAYNDVVKAIKLLHENDLVFGDLRRPNLLVVDRTNKGRKGVLLVDFDWCGKDGDAKYPDTLNDTGEIDWAVGVERNGPMKKEHDLYRLKRLEALIPYENFC